MRSLAKLAPLAVGLLIFAVVVDVLLSNQSPLGTWLVVAFLLGHGLVHIMFVVPSPALAGEGAGGLEYPFDAGKSWLVGDVLAAPSVRLLVAGLVAVAVVGYGLAASATIAILVPPTWWPSLVIVATVSSAALLLIALCRPGWRLASPSTSCSCGWRSSRPGRRRFSLSAECQAGLGWRYHTISAIRKRSSSVIS